MLKAMIALEDLCSKLRKLQYRFGQIQLPFPRRDFLALLLESSLGTIAPSATYPSALQIFQTTTT
jgi:hypothetical protein